MTQMNISMGQKQTQTYRTDLWLPRERGRGGGLGAGISKCKLLYTEWINKALLHSTGNDTQYPVINHNGKEYEKEYMCVYIYIYN